MISVTDLKSGVAFEEEGQILQVMSYEHIKMGRGSANIKVKVRNLTSGSILEKSFINGANVKNIFLESRQLQFLYKNVEVAYFMDPRTYEQIDVPIKNLPGHEFLIEGDTVIVQMYDGRAIALQLPPKVTIKVVDTAPGVKGNSASNVYKDAKLENGMNTRVRLFVENDDNIIVDTRDGSYTKRA